MTINVKFSFQLSFLGVFCLTFVDIVFASHSRDLHRGHYIADCIYPYIFIFPTLCFKSYLCMSVYHNVVPQKRNILLCFPVYMHYCTQLPWQSIWVTKSVPRCTCFWRKYWIYSRHKACFMHHASNAGTYWHYPVMTYWWFLYKLVYLHTYTYLRIISAYMPLYKLIYQCICSNDWREIFMKQSVNKCGSINFWHLCA